MTANKGSKKLAAGQGEVLALSTAKLKSTTPCELLTSGWRWTTGCGNKWDGDKASEKLLMHFKQNRFPQSRLAIMAAYIAFGQSPEHQNRPVFAEY